ncbi:hypothetical protein ZHAS_00022246 [Anopheles sinensis]|uniref:Uncharacterized protein n=1 Tax=Anopheles sinensis TaxID=74873 RepID=A0A084WUV0_ANOSI|nr:hypothetical protein ZHAS_00022246 [Anopheles sinensis]
MSVRWEAPGFAPRRRSAPEDECEIAMLPDAVAAAAGANEGDGDHSRSRNDTNLVRTASGGRRCPVAMVDAELSDDGQEAEDDSDGIVVLDEASERLLGRWNGSPKESAELTAWDQITLG